MPLFSLVSPVFSASSVSWRLNSSSVPNPWLSPLSIRVSSVFNPWLLAPSLRPSPKLLRVRRLGLIAGDHRSW